MALVKCKDCSEQVSKDAIKCPKCGADLSKDGIGGAIFVLSIICFGISFILPDAIGLVVMVISVIGFFVGGFLFFILGK